MKKILFVSLLTLSFLTFGTIHAQTPDLVATVNVYNAKIVSQNDRNLSVTFDLNNGDLGAQPQIRYGIKLTQAVKGAGDVTIDEQIFPDIISLGSNITVPETVAYTIPSTVSAGTYNIWVDTSSENGLPLGMVSLGQIQVTSNPQNSIQIIPQSCFLTLLGQGTSTTKYSLDQGVGILSTSTQTTLHCTVMNTLGNTVSVTPVFEIKEKSIYDDSPTLPIIAPVSTTSIQIQNGTNDISIPLTVSQALAPQVYYIATHLVSNDGSIVSNAVTSRYIKYGQAASIESIVLDRVQYAKGNTAIIKSLIWYSSPATTTITFIITNQNNQACSATSTQNLTESNQFLATNIPITNDCVNPKVSVTISSFDQTGKSIVLDASDFLVDSSGKGVTGNTQTSNSNNAKSLLAVVGVIIIIVCILFFILIRRKNKKTSDVFKTFVFIFLIASSVALYAPQKASANTWSRDCFTWSMSTDRPDYATGDTVTVSRSASNGSCASNWGNVSERMDLRSTSSNGVDSINIASTSPAQTAVNVVLDNTDSSFTAPTTTGQYQIPGNLYGVYQTANYQQVAYWDQSCNFGIGCVRYYTTNVITSYNNPTTEYPTPRGYVQVYFNVDDASIFASPNPINNGASTTISWTQNNPLASCYITQNGSTLQTISPTSNYGQLSNPSGLAIDISGNLYVANTGDNHIDEFPTNNGSVKIIGASRLSSPTGVAVDSQGNVYTVDSNMTIQKYGIAGNFTGYVDPTNNSHATAIAVDSQDNLYVGQSGKIRKYDKNGNYVSIFGDFGTSDFNSLFVDSQGNVYGLTTGNVAKEYFAPDYQSAAVIGSGDFSSAMDGITADSSGGVYITEDSKYVSHTGCNAVGGNCEEIIDTAKPSQIHIFSNATSTSSTTSCNTVSTTTYSGSDASAELIHFSNQIIRVTNISTSTTITNADTSTIITNSTTTISTSTVNITAGPIQGVAWSNTITYNQCTITKTNSKNNQTSVINVDGVSQSRHATHLGGVVVDSSGNMYVADQTTNIINKYNSSGNLMGSVGVPGTDISSPTPASGSFSITPSTNNTVYAISCTEPSGIVISDSSTVTFNGTKGKKCSIGSTCTPPDECLGNMIGTTCCGSTDNELVGGQCRNDGRNTCTVPTASNYGLTGACTFPDGYCTDSSATNYGQPGDCISGTVGNVIQGSCTAIQNNAPTIYVDKKMTWTLPGVTSGSNVTWTLDDGSQRTTSNGSLDLIYTTIGVHSISATGGGYSCSNATTTVYSGVGTSTNI